MKKQTSKSSALPILASVEVDLFGSLLGFHNKTMTLLRQSSLDDEKMKVVPDRIKTLLDAATAALNEAQQLNVTQQLATAYDEVKRLLEEFSEFPDDGKDH